MSMSMKNRIVEEYKAGIRDLGIADIPPVERYWERREHDGSRYRRSKEEIDLDFRSIFDWLGNRESEKQMTVLKLINYRLSKAHLPIFNSYKEYHNWVSKLMEKIPIKEKNCLDCLYYKGKEE